LPVGGLALVGAGRPAAIGAPMELPSGDVTVRVGFLVALPDGTAAGEICTTVAVTDGCELTIGVP
jgi:hypothetical protein